MKIVLNRYLTKYNVLRRLLSGNGPWLLIAGCSEIDPVGLVFVLAPMRGTSLFRVSLLKKHPHLQETLWSNVSATRCKVIIGSSRLPLRPLPVSTTSTQLNKGKGCCSCADSRVVRGPGRRGPGGRGPGGQGRRFHFSKSGCRQRFGGRS